MFWRDKQLLAQEKINRFPFLDILRYLKNTHKNPKFGRGRQVPTREIGWQFPGWDLSYFAKFGVFVGILLFFPVLMVKKRCKNNIILTSILQGQWTLMDGAWHFSAVICHFLYHRL